MTPQIPHLRIVIGFCVLAVVGYAGFSIWTLVVLKDATMVGDVIGTWKSFAVAAFAFWLGSSSGGKQRPPDNAEPGAPLKVDVVGTPDSPPDKPEAP